MKKASCVFLLIVLGLLYPLTAGAMIPAVELPPPAVKPVAAIELPPPNVRPVAAIELLPVLAREAPYSTDEIKVAAVAPQPVQSLQEAKPVAESKAKEEPVYQPVVRDMYASPQEYDPAVY